MAVEVEDRRFELIVGVHDLSEPADAKGEELDSWVAFSTAQPLLDTILANSRQTGVPLHVTSDDAFRSDYELLLPWLVDNRVKATFFVPTAFLDRPGRLTTGQLREMAALGIRIGVHGVRHLDWTGVGEAEFLNDVRDGRDRLQQTLGLAVDTVAPPYGRYDRRVLALLVSDGYREIHCCRPGLALITETLKPRNMIKQGAIASVLATSRRAAGMRDAARCRFRRLRASLDRVARLP